VAECETQLDLSGHLTPKGKVNGGEIKHLIANRGKQCVIDCKVGEWSEWEPVTQASTVQAPKCFEQRYRKILTAPAYGGEQCPALEEKREVKCPCTPYAELVLKSDSNDPHHGSSFFKYHVVRDRPPAGVSLSDQQVWEDELPKDTIRRISVQPNGDRYYAFYDADFRTLTETVTATCESEAGASTFNPYDPKLWVDCGCR
jgi:hypothetical protein